MTQFCDLLFEIVLYGNIYSVYLHCYVAAMGDAMFIMLTKSNSSSFGPIPFIWKWRVQFDDAARPTSSFFDYYIFFTQQRYQTQHKRILWVWSCDILYYSKMKSMWSHFSFSNWSVKLNGSLVYLVIGFTFMRIYYDYCFHFSI